MTMAAAEILVKSEDLSSTLHTDNLAASADQSPAQQEGQLHRRRSEVLSQSFQAETLQERLGTGPASFGPNQILPDDEEYEVSLLTQEQQAALQQIRHKMATLNQRPRHAFSDRQVRQIAQYKQFRVDKTIKMLRRVDARQLNVTISELEAQLRTLTLFPLPAGLQARKHKIHDLFYMRPSRYFPAQTTAKTIITNLIYVMETLRDRRPRNDGSRIGFIANMKDWTMSNFAVDYCQQFMFTLQGMKAAAHVDLFLIVNPPGWFDRVWYIMKPMLAASFRRKVHMISAAQLGDFLAPGFEQYLPNEFDDGSSGDGGSSVGKASAEQLVEDFIKFRTYYEQVTGERTGGFGDALLAPPSGGFLGRRTRRNKSSRVPSMDSTGSVSNSGGGGSSIASSNDDPSDVVSFTSDPDWTTNTEGESSAGQRTADSSASMQLAVARFGPSLSPRALEDQVRRLSPECSGTFFAIRDKMDKMTLVYPFSDAQILRVAWRNGFYMDRTVNALKRMDARQLNITAQELQPQLATMCLFPLPNGISAKVNGVQDLFYMRPSRYFPAKTRCRTIISNLIYVMDTIYERHRDRHRKMGFIANMDGWAMENFSVSYCKQFMYALQGKIAPSHVDLFLIVNPPGWFDKIWNIMKPMLAVNFRKKVHMIPQDRLHEFLSDGFEQHLPNEFAGIGKASVPQLVKDFVAFRRYHEAKTGARMPRAEQTSLMLPPKRVLRKMAREQKKRVNEHDIIDQIEVPRQSLVESHVSFDSEETDDDFNLVLGEEELNEDFQDDEDQEAEENGPGSKDQVTKESWQPVERRYADEFDHDESEVGVKLEAVQKLTATPSLPRSGSWSDLKLPGDSGHSRAEYGGYSDPVGTKPFLLAGEGENDSDSEDSFGLND